MIKRLLFLVLALLSFSARADYVWSGPGIAQFPDVASACQAGVKYWADVQNGGSMGTGTFTRFSIQISGTQTLGNCFATGSKPGYTDERFAYQVVRGGTVCTSPKVYNAATGACDAPPPPTCPGVGTDAGPTDVTTAYTTGPQPGSAIAKAIVPDGGLAGASWCSGKCTINPDMGKAAGSPCKLEQTPGPNGYYRLHCSIPMVFTGGQCTSGDVDSSPQNNPNSPPPAGSIPSEPSVKNGDIGKCPAGSVPTGTDSVGLTICTGTAKPSPSTSSNSTTQPSTTTTNSDGSTTKTDVTTQTNADGSTTTTTKTTTTAPDGTVTVAVKQDTGTTSTGSQGSKDVGDAEKDLCQRHPELNICRNSQVMGECGQITCTGDAIQCATLRATAAMECKQRKDDEELKASALFAKGDSLVKGIDPDAASLPSIPNAAKVPMPTSLDTGGFGGSGGPFDDVSFSVQGRTFTIPFNKWSSYLIALRYVMMIIASLVSFRMLSGAILKD